MITEPIADQTTLESPSLSQPDRKATGDSIRIIRSLDDLRDISGLWNDLLREDASPFQTHSWNLAWYRNFSQDYDEMLVVISAKEEAIFPLYRSGNTLRLAGDTVCDYQDAVADSEKTVRIHLRSLAEWAAAEGLDFHFAKLSNEGLLYGALWKEFPARKWFPPIEKNWGPCPWMRLRDTPEKSLDHLPRKLRAELRRQNRRVRTDFPDAEMRIEVAPEIEPESLVRMVEFQRSEFRLEAANPLEEGALVDLLVEVSNAPDTGLWLTRLGNRETPLAMDLGFVRGSRFYGYLTCFSGEHRRYSPGSCLLVSRLERLISAGVREFDFLCGPEPYKFRYATDHYEVKSIRLFPRSPQKAPFHLVFRANAVARRLARRFLGKGRDPVPSMPAS